MKQEDIQHLASLARLDLTDQECQDFTAEISEIIDFVKVVEEAHAGETVVRDMKKLNTFREDISYPSGVEEQIIAGFPEVEGKYLKVSKVLNND